MDLGEDSDLDTNLLAEKGVSGRKVFRFKKAKNYPSYKDGHEEEMLGFLRKMDELPAGANHRSARRSMTDDSMSSDGELADSEMLLRQGRDTDQKSHMLMEKKLSRACDENFIQRLVDDETGKSGIEC